MSRNRIGLLAGRQGFVHRTIVILACLCCIAQPLLAEDPLTIPVDVKVVTLPVTVRDKHGQIIRNLTKDDFVLEEDGRPQTIRYFSQESNLPFVLGLLVDTSLSQSNVLQQEREASKSFLNQMLTNAKDKAFLIHFDREVELLQDLTDSREKLQSALDLLKTSTPLRDNPDNEGSSPGSRTDDDSRPQSRSGSRMHKRAGTLLYDAVFLSSDELMKKQQGRKAVVILSDGVDRGSKTSLEGAVEAAQRADTQVYAIYFADTRQEQQGGFEHPHGGGTGRPGVGWPGGGWPGGGGGRRGGGQRSPEGARVDGKKILERISRETGGRLFEVSKKETVSQIYSTVAEELRTQYSLGYTPTKDEAAVPGYHKITLEARKKDLKVQTREGYYADR